VLQVFSVAGTVSHEDAFVLIGVLAEKLKLDFSRYMQHVHPVFIKSFTNVEESSVCVAAVGAIGDLCRGMEKAYLPYCNDIIFNLLEVLKSASLHRSVKPPVISALADISLAIAGDFDRYLEPVFIVLQQAGAVSYEPDQSEDDDLMEYINSMRSSVIDAYTGILQGMKSDGKQNVLIPAIDKVIELVLLCANDENRTDELLSSTLGLIGDLIDCYGIKMQPFCAQRAITELVQEGLAQQDPAIVRVSQWVQQLLAGFNANR